MLATLRDVTIKDSALLLKWRNLPEVSRYMYTSHVITQKEHEAWFEKALTDPTRKIWIARADDQDIGMATVYAIHQKHKRAEMGFYIAEASGRGLGMGRFMVYGALKYAFENLRLNKVTCEALAFNETAWGLYEHMGFEREGILRDHILRDDQYLDIIVTSMLQKDWPAHKAASEARFKQKAIEIKAS